MVAQYNVSLKDLISNGLLKTGDKLFAVPSRFAGTSALVNADGQLSLDGKFFSTPSAAAKHLSAKAENGWSFWKTSPENGQEKLITLRQKYLSRTDSADAQNSIEQDSNLQEFEPRDEPAQGAEVEETETAGVISSFGMFWRRNQVDWSKRVTQ